MKENSSFKAVWPDWAVLIVLVTNFIIKVTQMFGHSLGYSEKLCFWVLFGYSFGKFGEFFILTSGRTTTKLSFNGHLECHLGTETLQLNDPIELSRFPFHSVFIPCYNLIKRLFSERKKNRPFPAFSLIFDFSTLF